MRGGTRSGFRRLMSACWGKTPFARYWTAYRVMQRMLRRKDRVRRGLRVSVYRCVCCGAWHMGSTYCRED